jgi:hypothetical protein
VADEFRGLPGYGERERWTLRDHVCIDCEVRHVKEYLGLLGPATG